MSRQTVQMRGLVNGHVMEGPISAKKGDPRNIFWTTPERARHYIENRMAEPIVYQPAPKHSTAGPGETKPVEASQIKKSSPDIPLGHSIDSAKSDMSGQDAQSSAVPAEVPSQNNKPTISESGKNATRRRRGR